MKTITLTRAHGLAGVAAMLLGSVAWSGPAFAQGASNASRALVRRARTAATANAASANAAAQTDNFEAEAGGGSGGAVIERRGHRSRCKRRRPRSGRFAAGPQRCGASVLRRVEGSLRGSRCGPDGLGPSLQSRQLFGMPFSPGHRGQQSSHQSAGSHRDRRARRTPCHPLSRPTVRFARRVSCAIRTDRRTAACMLCL